LAESTKHVYLVVRGSRLIDAQAVGRGVDLSLGERLLERLKPDEVPGNEILLTEVMALRTIVTARTGTLDCAPASDGSHMQRRRLRHVVHAPV
jgi:hypothetical protein